MPQIATPTAAINTYQVYIGQSTYPTGTLNLDSPYMTPSTSMICAGQQNANQLSGGVFNCNMKGNTILVMSTAGEDNLYISVIRAWSQHAVSADTTAQPYFWSGLNQYTDTSLPKDFLIRSGSYYAYNLDWQLPVGNPNVKQAAGYAQYGIYFPNRVYVSEVFVIMSSSQDSITVTITNDPSSNSYKGNNNDITGAINCVSRVTLNPIAQIFCNQAGSILNIYTTNNSTLYIQKIAVIGYNCESKPVMVLDWPNNNIQVNSTQPLLTFDMPTVDQSCIWNSQKGYGITFVDISKRIPSIFQITGVQGVLQTDGSETKGSIKVDLSDPYQFGLFSSNGGSNRGNTYQIQVIVTPYHNPGGLRTNSTAVFQLYVGDSVASFDTVDRSLDGLGQRITVTPIPTPTPTPVADCSTTVINKYPGFFGVPIIYVYDPTPVYIDIPILTDKLSLANGNKDGVTYCGNRKFQLNGGKMFAKLVTSGSKTQVMLQSNSKQDIGSQILIISEALQNFPTVASINLPVIIVQIKDKCSETQMIVPDVSQLSTNSSITINVLATKPAYVQVPLIQDSISQNYGQKDGITFCGARSFILQNQGNFINWGQFAPQNLLPIGYSFNSMQDLLLLQSISNFDLGQHLVTIMVGLLNYPNVAPVALNIKVEVNPCIVEGLVIPKESKSFVTYTVISKFPSTQLIDFPNLQILPPCDNISSIVQFQIFSGQVLGIQNSQFQGNTVLKNWIKIDTVQKRILIAVTEEDKLTLQGLYIFTLLATLTTKENFFTSVNEFRIFFANTIAIPISAPISILASLINVNNTYPNSYSASDEMQNPIIVPESYLTDGATFSQWDQAFGGIFQPAYNQTAKNNDIQRPQVKVQSISSKGIVVLKFTKPMYTFNSVANRTIFIERNQRRLQSSGLYNERTQNFISQQSSFNITTNQTNYIKQKIFNVTLIPGNNSQLNALDFSYNAQFVDNQTMKVELVFTQPETVSAGYPEDIVMLSLIGPFLDQANQLALDPSNQTLKYSVPPQAIIGPITSAIEVAGTFLQASIGTAVCGSALSNIFLQGPLSQILGMINNLQLVVYFPLINVQFPGNAFDLFNMMITIASFDYLPTSKFYPQVFKTPPVDPYSDKFDRVGISDRFIVMNIGTLAIFIIWQIVLYPIYGVAYAFRNRLKCMNAIKNRLQNNLFWNGTILLVQEAYLNICICGFINIMAFTGYSWLNAGVVFCNILTVLLLVGVIILPIFVVVYLRPRFSLLRRESLKEKFGSMYQMINLEEDKSALGFCLLFYIRRILFAWATVFLVNYPYFQIVAILLPTLATLMFVGLVQPMTSRAENKKELYDSFTVITLNYTLFCLTEFLVDAKMRYIIGYVMVILIVQNIFVNLVIIAIEPIKNFIKFSKNCYAKFQRGKLFKQDKEQKNLFLEKIKSLKDEFFSEEKLETISEESEQDQIEEIKEADVLERMKKKQQVPQKQKIKQQKTSKTVKKIITKTKVRQKDMHELKPDNFKGTIAKLQEKARQVSRNAQLRRDLDYPESKAFYKNAKVSRTYNDCKVPKINIESLEGKFTKPYRHELMPNPLEILSQFKTTLDLIEKQHNFEQSTQAHMNSTFQGGKKQQQQRIIQNWTSEYLIDQPSQISNTNTQREKSKKDSDSPDNFSNRKRTRTNRLSSFDRINRL